MRKTDTADIFKAETDAMQFDLVAYRADKNNTIFYRENGSLTWFATTAEPYDVITISDMPYLSPTAPDAHYKSFGEVLRDYREANSITVPSLADMLGVPQRTLENWLAEKAVPNLFTIKSGYQMINIMSK